MLVYLIVRCPAFDSYIHCDLCTGDAISSRIFCESALDGPLKYPLVDFVIIKTRIYLFENSEELETESLRKQINPGPRKQTIGQILEYILPALFWKVAVKNAKILNTVARTLFDGRPTLMSVRAAVIFRAFNRIHSEKFPISSREDASGAVVNHIGYALNWDGEYIHLTALDIDMATVGGTTVGPVEPELRDRLAEYRDEHGHPNYNEALRSLLDNQERH